MKVAQLIKHILGLKAQFQGLRNFDLVYLWYPAPGAEAVEHEDEIRRFQELTDDCQPRVRFRAIAYPDLIQALARPSTATSPRGLRRLPHGAILLNRAQDLG